ncbi:uncharacterized protein LOC111277997 [Durio zibethinus]|uniref:Uncharacterized protein LOC111277997 n=1 Tax=Durio zibethinus TaxID=66656 RepID=A0A6P5WX15_DURZI|nr:uncharacterized protein LOC111277997 [Durio zibethinus]
MCTSKRDGGMGFRHLECFNQALLAKQGWKLLKNKDSLLFKVLSKRYFPDGNFLKAKLVWAPSLTWRSIWTAKADLLNGIEWRIGNRLMIRVWKDNWLTNNILLLLGNHAQNILGEDAKVAELIESQTRRWNRGFLE